MRRLSLEGDALSEQEAQQPARWMKVIVARPAVEMRPNRAYTIRQFEPDRRTGAMDFVLHGDPRPASASRAQIGDIVYLRWLPLKAH